MNDRPTADDHDKNCTAHVCHCGEKVNDHTEGSGHCPIELPCNCGVGEIDRN